MITRRSSSIPTSMLALLSLALLLGAQAAQGDASSHLRGVDPKAYDLYRPSADHTWTCLDGSATIPISAVNDDYCDCIDGSDEPGTSACRNATFHCQNKGHMPSVILSSRVNDGICDPECCDGTDEYDGKISCPNRCAQVGKEYRKRKAEAENIRRAGAKIRASYILETKKKQEQTLSEIDTLEVELEVAREKETRTKEAMEVAEKMESSIIEEKKASPLYGILKEQQDALRVLLEREEELKAELTKLSSLLDDLAAGYNPNNQDMVVKGAVMGYRAWRKDGEGEEDDDDQAATTEEGGEDASAGKSQADIKSQENVMLNKLTNEGDWPRNKIRDMADKDTLELMDDEMFKGAVADEESILFRLHEYLPEALLPFVDNLVDSFLDVLIKTRIISGVKRRQNKVVDTSEPQHVTTARKAYNDASSSVRDLSSKLSTKKHSLEANPAKWGRDNEWKALDGKCIEKNMGEYTYEFCFFGSATQKPNKGGSNVSLGRFSSFQPLQEGLTYEDDEYFLRQHYERGQRCWGGPDRTVNVELKCGSENRLEDVFEAEKCIYAMKVTTPAVCFDVKEEEQKKRDEL